MSEIFVFSKNETLPEVLIKIKSELKINATIKDSVDKSLVDIPLVIEVDERSIQKTLDFLKTRTKPIIVMFNKKSDFKLLEFFKMSLDKIFGFIDLTLDYEYSLPIVKNYLNLNFSKKTISIEKLASDVEKILEHTQTELGRIKNLHDRIVKLREEKTKSSTITIKFMAGEKSGGEFFDFSEFGSHVAIFELGADSYVASSLLISELEIFKERGPSLELVPNLINKILAIESEYKTNVNYQIAVLNTIDLTVDYFHKGLGKILLNNETKSIQSNGKFKLNRDDRLLFLSEGAIKNWNLFQKESNLLTFIKEKNIDQVSDFLNEFFFELYKNKSGLFLNYDAMAIIFQINKNAIHKL